MDKIASFQLESTEINILHKEGKLGYNFQFDGEYYGQQVSLEDESVLGVVTATMLLLVNVLETKKALEVAKAEGKLPENKKEENGGE